MSEPRQSFDPKLARDVLEFYKNGEYYRCVKVLKSRYEITGLLSVGGFGVIYEAKDRHLYGKKVLVKTNRYDQRDLKIPNNKKVLDQVKMQRDRFVHERKMLLHAQSRKVAQAPVLIDEIIDYGVDLFGPHESESGQAHYYDMDVLYKVEPYLVLSYQNGKPVDSISQEDLFFTQYRLKNAKSIIFQIGNILKSFHEEQDYQGKKLSFVYQDLKPANIIWTKEKTFSLIDFGSFAIRVDGVTKPNFARTGTPGFQPPEFSNYGFPVDKIDARADIFSLGATIYYVITGVPPRVNHNNLTEFDSDALNQLLPQWRHWLEKCTHININERFSSMDEAIKFSRDLPLKG